MSWWNEGGGEPPQDSQETKPDPGTTPGETGDTKDGAPKADLTGKPDWMPDNFWMAPEGDAAADFAKMAEKMAGALKEGRQKITTQGEQLAKYVVPDGTAPYFEGLDKDAFVKAHERSGLDAAQIDQFMAQARSAGIGPAPARALLQSWGKSRHEATEAPKTPEMLAEAAIAELNAAGRPGSEMAKRVRTWVGGLVGEQKLSEKQAEALGVLMGTSHGLEAAHSLIGTVPAGPADSTRVTHSNKSIVDAINKKLDDPRFGVDPAYTADVMREQKANESAIAAVYGMDDISAAA